MQIELEDAVLTRLKKLRPSSRYIYIILKYLERDGQIYAHYDELMNYTNYSLKTVVESLAELVKSNFIESTTPYHGRYVFINPKPIK